MRERGKRIVRSVAVVASVIGATLGLAVTGTAQAYSGPHYWMFSDDGNPGGRVDFWPDGDIVQVCDIQADDAHVHVVLYDINTMKGYDLTASGNGVCSTHRASEGSAYDLPERGTLQGCMSFNIRLWKGSAYVWGSEDKAYWWNDNSAKQSDC